MFGCNLENFPKKFQAFRLYEEKEFVKTQFNLMSKNSQPTNPLCQNSL